MSVIKGDENVEEENTETEEVINTVDE